MRLGTRKSALALAQSGQVAASLGADVRLVHVVTAGDRLVDAPLTAPLAKGWFTSALEDALRAGEVDLAVHSLKDLPVAGLADLPVAATPKRASVADCLVVRADAIDRGRPGLPLREGARVGTSSPRRAALLNALLPGAASAFLRGNVNTRLDRVREGAVDAALLAEAGLDRLVADLSGCVVFRLDPSVWVPAPGQGALALQCRADDAATRARLAAVHHAESAADAALERELLAALGGGCQEAFGAWARGEHVAIGLLVGERFVVRGAVPRAEAHAALSALRAGEAGDRTPEIWWKELE